MSAQTRFYATRCAGIVAVLCFYAALVVLAVNHLGIIQ